ncbi:hypothetical protein MKK70_21435 [Methylobacterium sp. E-041]|uniref:hypothetical protein n=1 Tax=Methylobacterium sp. E-041 TaxID=2836573 RepID=UPI001FB8F480|nr:hypothetical protein [Methylobacterium sp. E-041]MCJ2107892.1 hypothetical protein [Methylobacterium sp. E-041]
MPNLPTPSEIIADNHAAAERHASEHGTVTPDAAIATLEAAFTPTRQALLRVLTMVQNCSRYAEQDIMTICGLCSTAEISDHLWTNFRYLPKADKVRVLAALRAEADAALAEAA